jgi:hypothetical protein
MEKEKQIEEMAKHCYNYHEGFCYADYENPTACYIYSNSEYRYPRRKECDLSQTFENLIDAGYRKASDVAEDIIRILRAAGINEHRYPVIAKIKKKYTGEKDDGKGKAD